MSKISVTLTRAHKIAERIGSKLGELKTSLVSTEVAVRFSAAPTVDQTELVRANAAEVLAKVALFEQLVATQAAIRETIAKGNVSGGVSSALSEVEGNKKLIAFYETLIASHTPGAEAVHVDSLGTFVWPQGTSYGASTVNVTGRSRAEIAQLVLRKEELERVNFTLNDKLADLNAQKVDIEVSDELKALLGL